MSKNPWDLSYPLNLTTKYSWVTGLRHETQSVSRNIPCKYNRYNTLSSGHITCDSVVRYTRELWKLMKRWFRQEVWTAHLDLKIAGSYLTVSSNYTMVSTTKFTCLFYKHPRHEQGNRLTTQTNLSNTQQMCMIFTNRFPERRGKYWAENNDPIHQNPLLLARPALWIYICCWFNALHLYRLLRPAFTYSSATTSTV